LEYQKYLAATEDLSKAKFTREEAIDNFQRILRMSFKNSEEAFDRLLSEGFLVHVGSGYYRTLHFDLAYRASHIRIHYDTMRYPLEAKVYVRDEGLPNFTDVKFERLKEIAADEIYTVLEESLLKSGKEGEKIEGFSNFQWESISKILAGKSKAYVLTAGTASGKTYAFLIPALIKILQDKLVSNRRSGTKVMLVYPRKSLERDQLDKVLSILYRINTYLEKTGRRDKKITVGVDDGETPWRSGQGKVNDGDSFRGAICAHCGRGGAEGGELAFLSRRGQILIRCKNCDTIYDWIFGVREDVWENKPDILITNVWTLDFRLPSTTIQSKSKIFKDLQLIVMDEAHVYQSLLGGNIRYLLKRLKGSAEQEPIVVLSSATIPTPEAFSRRLLDLKDVEFEIIKPEEGVRKKKIVYLILAINPQKAWETAVYELSLLLATAYKYRGLQSVIFIDSKKELYRVLTQSRVATLVYGEPKDHMDNSLELDDPYLWPYRGNERFVEGRTPKEIFSKIAVHHADVKDREQIELDFTLGNLGVLISTSTLELGVDYPKVGVVVNVGLPFQLESIPQRIGRAGRDEGKTLNTILAIIILRNTPLELYYLYNWRDLIEGFKYKIVPIAWKNISVKRYHALSALIDEMAKKGEETYILRTDGSLDDPEYFVNKILSYLEKGKPIVGRLDSRSEADKPSPSEILDDVKMMLAKLPGHSDEIFDFHAKNEEVYVAVLQARKSLRMARRVAKHCGDDETVGLAKRALAKIWRSFNV
jgi:ATP-dependent helicase YprA (DUF1998 family)